jgi:hypothetical protein
MRKPDEGCEILRSESKRRLNDRGWSKAAIHDLCVPKPRTHTFSKSPDVRRNLQFGFKKRSLKATIEARLFGRKSKRPRTCLFVSSGSIRGSFLWDDDAFAAHNWHVLGRTQKVPDPSSSWNVVIVEPELRVRDNSRKD